MSKQQSKRTGTDDASRVDHLLSLLGDLSQRDPTPSLRERLSKLASQRLKKNPVHAGRLENTGRGVRVWLKPALAAILLLAVGLTAVFVIHFRRQQLPQPDRTARVSHPGAPSNFKDDVAPAVRSVATMRHKIQHLQLALLPLGARQMALRLPYSNSAIETGTNTTIRVSMPQSELLLLGFPINTTAQDRRILAELTLGDDGLPRAISVPLPLEVMKENQ
jgi:hypothetical protein